MVGYPVQIGENEAKAAVTHKRISTKSSIILAKRISGMEVGKAKQWLQDLAEGKARLNGKHYTKTALGIIDVLKLAESNAKNRGLEGPITIRTVSAEMGPKRQRRKQSWSTGRLYAIMKLTHVKVVVTGTKSKEKTAEKKVEKTEHAHKETKTESKTGHEAETKTDKKETKVAAQSAATGTKSQEEKK